MASAGASPPSAAAPPAAAAAATGVDAPAIPNTTAADDLPANLNAADVVPEDVRFIGRVGGRPAREQFLEAVKDAVAGSFKRELVIFIHGYNVGHEGAIKSAAQLTFDTAQDYSTIDFPGSLHETVFRVRWMPLGRKLLVTLRLILALLATSRPMALTLLLAVAVSMQRPE